MSELTETENNSYEQLENKIEEIDLKNNIDEKNNNDKEEKDDTDKKNKDLNDYNIDNILGKLEFAVALYPKLIYTIIILIIIVIIFFVIIIILGVRKNKYKKNYKKYMEL